MSLSSFVANQFAADVRARGKEYFALGRARIKRYGSNFVEASVTGSRKYDVLLELLSPRLDISCTCPYFKEYARCKHVWATILTADAQNILQPKPGESTITVESIPDDFNDDLDFENDLKDGDDDISIGGGKHIVKFPGSMARHLPAKPVEPDWRALVTRLPADDTASTASAWPENRQLVYCIDPTETLNSGDIHVSVSYRQKKRNGTWTTLKPVRIDRDKVDSLPLPEDRKIMSVLKGAKSSYGWGYYNDYSFHLTPALTEIVLPMMCATGRCIIEPDDPGEAFIPLEMDPGAPWIFRLEIVRHKNKKDYVIRGYLEKDGEIESLAAPIMLLSSGWVIWKNRVARLDDSKSFQWIVLLRKKGTLTVPEKEAGDIPVVLAGRARMPPVKMPDEIKYEEIPGVPKIKLMIKKPEHPAFHIGTLNATLAYEYAGHEVTPELFSSAICLKDKRQLIMRDVTAEQNAVKHLDSMGLKRVNYRGLTAWRWEIKASQLPQVVSALTSIDWTVQAEGQAYRKPGVFNVEVSSGIDWFELHAKMDFDGVTANLPALLKAIRNKDHFITLGDGTIGILPEEWLKKYGTIAALGKTEGDHVKFRRHQAGLLDALIAAQPDVKCDETFARIREELKSFESIKPSSTPQWFVGKLRDYQSEGLGWLNFLRQFGFGGCLADDMGLGKTIQALALLEMRRAQRAAGKKDGKNAIGPSLVVVPRSLVFNWTQEAMRFTPKLRILDHTHPERERKIPDFSDYDLVLITYGILSRDITHLKDIVFDYAILDEAQAIKNVNAQAAKAARLLNCRYRLAMSGTPVQNHLGELWSLFEFLNPGMLGAASVFNLTEAGSRNPPEETRQLLSHALRPFILRRTKGQVAKELPERTEETLFCEMSNKQRKLYDELRNHYKAVLLDKIDTVGINKSKIVILEALLRLRQAACHPGLIDKDRINEPCAKLDSLLPQLVEVIEEGHKAIVFSQFTSFLAIVQKQLKSRGINYEYLDGQTRDRQTPVERFQNDENCKLFLVSLKAGGLGLNLTAAEYVFLLDPWWNPAIEAQAIDRAHRIGQTRKVFAYRLIASDTVEEKVLELQKTKKELAESIIKADNSLIRTLTKEDLQLLLA